MGSEIEVSIQNMIDEVRSYNDASIHEEIDRRVQALVITKLEEAQLWFSKIKHTRKPNIIPNP